MSDAIIEAEEMISNENYEEALKLAKSRHGKDDIESYLTILDMLIDKDYLRAIEEKGLYYQYIDPSHDDGDYGEKYFDRYLKMQPKSVNAICDKAMSRFNKNSTDEALKYLNEAYENYDSYSEAEKPRISKKEVQMNRIEVLIKTKEYENALNELNDYENNFGVDSKLDLYKGIALQKTGHNEEALEYLNRSFRESDSINALNSIGDAYYDMGDYNKAFKTYKTCIASEFNVDDLELLTNFNYKAAYCQINMGNEQEGIKYLNKTIGMLNVYGRLPKDIEEIYQKCSFEKERLLKKGSVEDITYKESRLGHMKTSLTILAVILILYVILKLIGY